MYKEEESWDICPCCGEDTLEERSNLYGTWVECTECGYEGDQK